MLGVLSRRFSATLKSVQIYVRNCKMTHLIGTGMLQNHARSMWYPPQLPFLHDEGRLISNQFKHRSLARDIMLNIPDLSLWCHFQLSQPAQLDLIVWALRLQHPTSSDTLWNGVKHCETSWLFRGYTLQLTMSVRRCLFSFVGLDALQATGKEFCCETERTVEALVERPGALSVQAMDQHGLKERIYDDHALTAWVEGRKMLDIWWYTNSIEWQDVLMFLFVLEQARLPSRS